MPLNPFVLSAEQRILIGLAEIRTESKNCWSDENLTELKLSIKKHYLYAQRNICCYCKNLISINHLRAWDLDHIAPRSLYPQFTFEPANLAIACIDCNSAKSDYDTIRGAVVRYPRTSSRFTIVHAHLDDWDEHIERGKFRFAAKTAKGSETIYRCNLFRFYQQATQSRNSIRDRRFEIEVENLLYAKSADEARDSLRIIVGRLNDLTINENIEQIIEHRTIQGD